MYTYINDILFIDKWIKWRVCNVKGVHRSDTSPAHGFSFIAH